MLAEYLGRDQSSISRYNPKKRELMILGLEQKIKLDPSLVDKLKKKREK